MEFAIAVIVTDKTSEKAARVAIPKVKTAVTAMKATIILAVPAAKERSVSPAVMLVSPNRKKKILIKGIDGINFQWIDI